MKEVIVSLIGVLFSPLVIVGYLFGAAHLAFRTGVSKFYGHCVTDEDGEFSDL